VNVFKFAYASWIVELDGWMVNQLVLRIALYKAKQLGGKCSSFIGKVRTGNTKKKTTVQMWCLKKLDLKII
jgi:hypothetical protein